MQSQQITKIYASGRGTGKTTALIEECSKYNHALIVVPNKARALNVAKMAREMMLDIPFPITFSELLYGYYHGKPEDAFLFDDLIECLSLITGGVPIAAVALRDERKTDG